MKSVLNIGGDELNKKLILKSLKVLTWIVFILYLAILIYVIVLKSGRGLIVSTRPEISFMQKLSGINVIPFKTIVYYLNGNQGFNTAIDNILGNIIAFNPLGFLMPILLNKYKKLVNIFFISVALSLSIEIIQLLFNLGSCDVDDFILNVLGSILGFGVYKILNPILKKFRSYFIYIIDIQTN